MSKIEHLLCVSWSGGFRAGDRVIVGACNGFILATVIAAPLSEVPAGHVPIISDVMRIKTTVPADDLELEGFPCGVWGNLIAGDAVIYQSNTYRVRREYTTNVPEGYVPIISENLPYELLCVPLEEVSRISNA